jgi:hypothetical protein
MNHSRETTAASRPSILSAAAAAVLTTTIATKQSILSTDANPINTAPSPLAGMCHGELCRHPHPRYRPEQSTLRAPLGVYFPLSVGASFEGLALSAGAPSALFCLLQSPGMDDAAAAPRGRGAAHDVHARSVLKARQWRDQRRQMLVAGEIAAAQRVFAATRQLAELQRRRSGGEESGLLDLLDHGDAAVLGATSLSSLHGERAVDPLVLAVSQSVDNLIKTIHHRSGSMRRVPLSLEATLRSFSRAVLYSRVPRPLPSETGVLDRVAAACRRTSSCRIWVTGADTNDWLPKGSGASSPHEQMLVLEYFASFKALCDSLRASVLERFDQLAHRGLAPVFSSSTTTTTATTGTSAATPLLAAPLSAARSGGGNNGTGGSEASSGNWRIVQELLPRRLATLLLSPPRQLTPGAVESLSQALGLNIPCPFSCGFPAPTFALSGVLHTLAAAGSNQLFSGLLLAQAQYAASAASALIAAQQQPPPRSLDPPRLAPTMSPSVSVGTYHQQALLAPCVLRGWSQGTVDLVLDVSWLGVADTSGDPLELYISLWDSLSGATISQEWLVTSGFPSDTSFPCQVVFRGIPHRVATSSHCWVAIRGFRVGSLKGEGRGAAESRRRKQAAQAMHHTAASVTTTEGEHDVSSFELDDDVTAVPSPPTDSSHRGIPVCRRPIGVGVLPFPDSLFKILPGSSITPDPIILHRPVTVAVSGSGGASSRGSRGDLRFFTLLRSLTRSVSAPRPRSSSAPRRSDSVDSLRRDSTESLGDDSGRIQRSTSAHPGGQGGKDLHLFERTPSVLGVGLRMRIVPSADNAGQPHVVRVFPPDGATMTGRRTTVGDLEWIPTMLLHARDRMNPSKRRVVVPGDADLAQHLVRLSKTVVAGDVESARQSAVTAILMAVSLSASNDDAPPRHHDDDEHDDGDGAAAAAARDRKTSRMAPPRHDDDDDEHGGDDSDSLSWSADSVHSLSGGRLSSSVGSATQSASLSDDRVRALVLSGGKPSLLALGDALVTAAAATKMAFSREGMQPSSVDLAAALRLVSATPSTGRHTADTTTIFLTLTRGSFAQDSKRAPRNMEVRVQALSSSTGKPLAVLGRAANAAALSTEYHSTVYYHSNSPVLDERIAVVLHDLEPEDIHLRLSFWHVSSSVTKSHCVSFAFLRLADADGIMLSDGTHELICYEPSKHDGLEYLRGGVPSTRSELEGTMLYGNGARRLPSMTVDATGQTSSSRRAIVLRDRPSGYIRHSPDHSGTSPDWGSRSAKVVPMDTARRGLVEEEHDDIRKRRDDMFFVHT